MVDVGWRMLTTKEHKGTLGDGIVVMVIWVFTFVKTHTVQNLSIKVIPKEKKC